MTSKRRAGGGRQPPRSRRWTSAEGMAEEAGAEALEFFDGVGGVEAAGGGAPVGLAGKCSATRAAVAAAESMMVMGWFISARVRSMSGWSRG